MVGVLKLGRKSAIYLFLFVITGSFTLKNVDKRDGYIVSDVSELFVVKSMSMEATHLLSSIRIKRPVMTKGGNQVFKFSVSSAQDVLFLNLILLWGDVLQNPAPVLIQYT